MAGLRLVSRRERRRASAKGTVAGWGIGPLPRRRRTAACGRKPWLRGRRAASRPPRSPGPPPGCRRPDAPPPGITEAGAAFLPQKLSCIFASTDRLPPRGSRDPAEPPPQAADPGHLLHEPGYRRPGQHDRQRRAAVHPARPARLGIRPAVGGGRLHAGAGQLPGAGGVNRGPAGAAQHLPGRRWPPSPSPRCCAVSRPAWALWWRSACCRRWAGRCSTRWPCPSS